MTASVWVDLSVLVATEVAVMVALTGVVGTTAPEMAVSVRVALPVPADGVMVVELHAPVMPVGRPVTATVTFPVNEPPVRIVTTLAAVAP